MQRPRWRMSAATSWAPTVRMIASPVPVAEMAQRVVRVGAGADQRRVADAARQLVGHAAGRRRGGEAAVGVERHCADRALRGEPALVLALGDEPATGSHSSSPCSSASRSAPGAGQHHVAGRPPSPRGRAPPRAGRRSRPPRRRRGASPIISAASVSTVALTGQHGAAAGVEERAVLERLDCRLHRVERRAVRQRRPARRERLLERAVVGGLVAQAPLRGLPQPPCTRMTGSATARQATRMTRLVLWDIDGTLVDSAGLGRDAFVEAFEQVTGVATRPARAVRRPHRPRDRARPARDGGRGERRAAARGLRRGAGHGDGGAG